MTLKTYKKIQFGVQEWQVIDIFEQILKYLDNKDYYLDNNKISAYGTEQIRL